MGAVALVLVAIPNRESCPVCRKNIEKRWRSFCSECGSDKLMHPRFLSLTLHYPECRSCRKTPFWTGRGQVRGHKVRYCTHCGAHLSTDGI